MDWEVNRETINGAVEHITSEKAYFSSYSRFKSYGNTEKVLRNLGTAPYTSKINLISSKRKLIFSKNYYFDINSISK